MLSLIPSRAQWKRWSLPSRLTCLGAYLGAASLLLAIVFFVWPITLTRPDRIAAPAYTSSHATDESHPNERPSDTNISPAKPPAPLQARFSPVSFAEVLRVSQDATLTDLQKDEFRRKHQERLVEWTVEVMSVSRLWLHQADSDFSVVFRPAAHEDPNSLRLGDVGVAIFPASLRKDMLDLQTGDIIRMRGTLQFLDLGASHTISVRDCQLLERRKP